VSRLPRDRRKPAPAAAAPMVPRVVSGPEFPRVSLSGGPSPKDTFLSIDGQPPKRAFMTRIEVGIDHAAKVTISQYAEVDVRLADAEIEDAGFVAVIRRPNSEGTVLIEMEEVARGEGATLRDAIHAAADQLPDESQVH
jgi:hypothetical protein